jgi:hypothetical protein
MYKTTTRLIQSLIGGEAALEDFPSEAQRNDTKMDPFPFQRFP